MSLFLIFIPAALFFLASAYYVGIHTCRMGHESALYMCSICHYPIITIGIGCPRCGSPVPMHNHYLSGGVK